MDGTQIPYTTSTNTQIQTTFKNAVLKLEVTPQITPNGSVIMELDITNNSPGTPVYVGGPLPITTKELQTTVQVNDGETVVLGGTFLQDLSHNTNKIPFFGDLPGVGWMFRNKSDNDNKRELLIFVTPKIVKETLSIH
jgi:type IV pilus assembly protein PilQ